MLFPFYVKESTILGAFGKEGIEISIGRSGVERLDRKTGISRCGPATVTGSEPHFVTEDGKASLGRRGKQGTGARRTA